MAVYTCPTCGEKMERDLTLFMDHTDAHIVEEVKKLHPTWITDDGFCAKCLDYYKKARLGEATNLDSAGVKRRYVLGIVGFGGAAATWFWLNGAQAPRETKWILFPLFFMGLLGLIQAQNKFCVVIAQQQAEAMRRRAFKMLLLVAGLAIVLTVVAYYF